MLVSPAMNADGLSRSKWLQALLCVWMLAAQVWYYFQFSGQLRSIIVLALHKLWH